MNGLLEGRIAAITGGGSGIGRAIALGYAKQGAAVVVLDANAATAAQTATSIKGDGGAAWSFELDVADHAACRRLAADVPSRSARSRSSSTMRASIAATAFAQRPRP